MSILKRLFRKKDEKASIEAYLNTLDIAKEDITKPQEVKQEQEVITKQKKLTEKQQELWDRYSKGKETQTAIAKSLGISQPAICKRLKVIEKRL